MSKLGRISLVIMILGLAFIASLRLYRSYEEQVKADQENMGAAMTFNQVAVHHEPAEVETPVYQRLPIDDRLIKDIFLEDPALPAEQAQEQARATINSILEDYRENPQLREFYKEVKETTGQKIDLSAMSQGNMGELLKQYPQLQEIINRHTQDPQFAATIQEIFSNPEFVRSVIILQQSANQTKETVPNE